MVDFTMHLWKKSPTKDCKTKSNKRILQDLFRSRRGSSSSGSASSNNSPKGPHLTRTRKLRHIADDDLIIGTRTGESLSLDHRSDPGSVRDSQSPSSVTRTVSNLDNLASAQPLPLPHGGNGNLSPLRHGHGHSPLVYDMSPPLPLPSPKQVLCRTESDDVHGGWGIDSASTDDSEEESLESAATPRCKPNAHHQPEREAMSHGCLPSYIDTSRKSPEHALALSSQIVLGAGGQLLKGHKDARRDVVSRLHLNVKNVAKSAPTTVLSSPALSPRRLSSGDFLPSRNSKINQGHDIGISSVRPSGQTSMMEMIMQPSSEKVLISPDLSPLPSPSMRSPRLRSRIHSGAVSPLHPSFSTGLHGDGANVNVHRLPLPPGSSSPVGVGPLSPTSPSISVQRSSVRSETSVTPRRWQKGKHIGSGTFGTVYVGLNRETGDMCAMKEVPLIPDDSKSSESIKQLEQEINLLSQLKHPNIVQYFGSETSEDAFYIYLEYVPGGSIFKLLSEYGPLPEPVIRIYTRQILSGLAYLHSMNTVHRDIKGANLLADTSGKIKLADFGMAKHINGPATPVSLKGSPYWMAPEIMMPKNTGYDFSVDIWSLGCTVIEMATGKPPWSEYEGAAAMFKVFKSEVPSIPETLSPEGQEFIRCCLRRNPTERPTASQLLDHAFIRNASQQDSDPLASATSRIMSLSLVQSPREKSMNVSNCTGFSLHSGNSKSYQLPSEPIHPQIGTSVRSLNPQLSPRSTLEPFSSLSPPRSNATMGGALTGNVPNGFPSRVGAIGVVNCPELSTDYNWNSPFTRTPEGSPKRWDYTPDIDMMQTNVGWRVHEFEEGNAMTHDPSRFVREIAPQLPLRTPAYPSVYP